MSAPQPFNELTLAQLPCESDSLTEAIETFCLSIDGYDEGRRTIAACLQIAAEVEGDWAGASLANVRIAAFIWQRQIRWNDQGYVPAGLVEKVLRAVREIRQRVEAA